MLDAIPTFAIETIAADINDAFDLVASARIKGKLDLGSVEVILVETPDHMIKLVLLTSSGDAAIIPADFFFAA